MKRNKAVESDEHIKKKRNLDNVQTVNFYIIT